MINDKNIKDQIKTACRMTAGDDFQRIKNSIENADQKTESESSGSVRTVHFLPGRIIKAVSVAAVIIIPVIALSGFMNAESSDRHSGRSSITSYTSRTECITVYESSSSEAFISCISNYSAEINPEQASTVPEITSLPPEVIKPEIKPGSSDMYLSGQYICGSDFLEMKMLNSENGKTDTAVTTAPPQREIKADKV